MDLAAYDQWAAQVRDDVARELKITHIGGLAAYVASPRRRQRNISIWSMQFVPWTERCSAPEAYRGDVPVGWLTHGAKTCILCGTPMDAPALERSQEQRSWKRLDGTCSECSAQMETVA